MKMQDVPERGYSKHRLTKDKLRHMLDKMLLLRRFEEKVEGLFLVRSQISAAVLESAFDYLDAPIVRVACPEMPIPFSPTLEQMHMPNAGKIVEAVARIMG
jgi:hypothetical protein